MILEIFLPEKIFGSRVISKKILSIDLNSKYAIGVKVEAKPKQCVVENVYQEKIKPGEEKTYKRRASSALKKLIGSQEYDQIYISIPASKVIFKELTIPLKNIEKIRMVVEHEVEEQLPFSIDNAVIDFIVTEQSKMEVSRVLVAAIRNSDLQEILDVYTSAGIDPTNITIDLFSLYHSYKMIPEYKNLPDGSSLVDIGNYSTRISFIENGSLRLIRNIPKGISTLAHEISQDTNQPIEEIENELKSGTISTNNLAQKHLISYANEIQFTLNSFSIKLSFYKEIKKILFTNLSTDFVEFASNILQTPCETFDIAKIFKVDGINKKTKKLVPDWSVYAIALSTALSSISPNEFNFRRKSFELVNIPLIRKQIQSALILISFSVFTIGGFGYWQINRLSKVAQSLEQNEIKNIKDLLEKNKKSTNDASLQRLISKALSENNLQPLYKKFSQITSIEENTWLDLDKLQIHPLKILYILTNIIDKTSFNISINELVLGQKIVIDGVLRSKAIGEDWNEFAKFTRQLEVTGKSNGLVLENVDDALADNGGVKFKLTFNQVDLV